MKTKNIVLTAPNRLNDCEYNSGIKFFIAGTIDDGESINFQNEICEWVLNNEFDKKIIIFNPRRNNWNKDAGSKEIVRQIDWELEHMEKADYIIMNILGNSKSPISLLELGLHARDGKLIVFCPKSFYRYDNVRVTCETYGVKLYSIEDYNNNIDEIKLLILEKKNG